MRTNGTACSKNTTRESERNTIMARHSKPSEHGGRRWPLITVGLVLLAGAIGTAVWWAWANGLLPLDGISIPL